MNYEARVYPWAAYFPLTQPKEASAFFVWATKTPWTFLTDTNGQGLADAQGETHEKVVDIVCADGLRVDPTTGRCPAMALRSTFETCKISTGSGAGELKTVWRDPHYDQTRAPSTTPGY